MRTISEEEASMVGGAGLWDWLKALVTKSPSSENNIGYQNGPMAVVVVSGRRMTSGEAQAYDTWSAAQAAGPGCTVTSTSNHSVTQNANLAINASLTSIMGASNTLSVACVK